MSEGKRTGKIVSLNISEEKGVVKIPVDEFTLDELGIVGDAHAGRWHRQVSLLGQETVDRFIAENKRDTKPGEFAENMTLRGLDLGEMAVLDRISIGDVELEVTQIGKKCHGSGCAIYNEVGTCIMPKEGIFTRVLTGGKVSPGDEIVHTPRPFRIHVITLSDRASQGEYSDRSGPRTVELLNEFYADKRWHLQITTTLMPDNRDDLSGLLRQLTDAGVDAIFTLGSTGVGPRDIAPEAIAAVTDKVIPGIMDHIRLKYGADKPAALLSRSVAAMIDSTLVFALPGSVRAVQEYVAEILKSIEHMVFMVHGLDNH
ncbi:MAG: molybdenum cofactor synthesis protein [bacterium]|nr:molybdenum cofactor synthesis protein [bacterium]